MGIHITSSVSVWLFPALDKYQLRSSPSPTAGQPLYPGDKSPQDFSLNLVQALELFWSNYEPLNEEWDCPVADGAKSQSTWKVILGDTKALDTLRLALRANDMNVHYLTLKHGCLFKSYECTLISKRTDTASPQDLPSLI